MNVPSSAIWYGKRAPALGKTYPAWGYDPTPQPDEPKPAIKPGRALLGLTIAALASLAWWLS